MSIHTAYKFRHFNGEGRLLWASGLGEMNDEELRRGSPLLEDVDRAQDWILNELADAGEQSMLDVWFRAAVGPTFHFALFDDTPVDTDTPATLVGEVVGTGYARRAVPRDAVGWPTLALNAGDYRATSRVETFTAGGTWTAATQLCLMSDLSGTTGSFWAWAPLSVTRTLLNADTLDVTLAVALG